MKKLVLSIGALMLAGIIGLGIAQTSAVEAEPDLSKSDIKQKVSDQYPGTVTELELDESSGKVAYEVAVETETKEYELKVDGNTGEILQLKEKQRSVSNSQEKGQQSKSETEDDSLEIKERQSNIQEDGSEAKASASNSSGQKGEKDNEGTKEKAIISYDEAKNIALGEFSGQLEDIELDEDDGQLRYEVEIEKKESDAEIEIDAYTGEILIIEIDD